MECPIRHCASGRLICCLDCNRGEICVHACTWNTCPHIKREEPSIPEVASILDRYHSKGNEPDAAGEHEGGEVGLVLTWRKNLMYQWEVK